MEFQKKNAYYDGKKHSYPYLYYAAYTVYSPTTTLNSLELDSKKLFDIINKKVCLYPAKNINIEMTHHLFPRTENVDGEECLWPKDKPAPDGRVYVVVETKSLQLMKKVDKFFKTYGWVHCYKVEGLYLN